MVQILYSLRTGGTFSCTVHRIDNLIVILHFRTAYGVRPGQFIHTARVVALTLTATGTITGEVRFFSLTVIPKLGLVRK